MKTAKLIVLCSMTLKLESKNPTFYVSLLLLKFYLYRTEENAYF